MTSKEIPFPSLRAEALKARQEIPVTGDCLCLMGLAGCRGRVYLAALPWLMHERPFVEKNTASGEMAEVLAAAHPAVRGENPPGPFYQNGCAPLTARRAARPPILQFGAQAERPVSGHPSTVPLRATARSGLSAAE